MVFHAKILFDLLCITKNVDLQDWYSNAIDSEQTHF